LFASVLLIIAGCGPLTVSPTNPISPEDAKPVESLWTVLADSIDNPDTFPKNTTQLQLMMRHMRSLGKITDEQVTEVSNMLGGFKKEIPLTKQHSDLIRRMK
jgi:hypothetical protein